MDEIDLCLVLSNLLENAFEASLRTTPARRKIGITDVYKRQKYGRLPDFDANGELVEIEDDPTRPDEGNTAFRCV